MLFLILNFYLQAARRTKAEEMMNLFMFEVEVET